MEQDHGKGKIMPQLNRATANEADQNSEARPIHNFETRPRIITLCGSTRFWDDFVRLNAELTLQGCVVFSVAVPSSKDGRALEPQQKSILDAVHLHKIRMSDEILVINPGRYIGDSTRREIEFARKIGRTVRYLEDMPEGPLFE